MTIDTPRLGYVPALDGLRAAAVMAVLGAHSGLEFFAGGDVGVDVFFVLSGFLITTLILEEKSRFGRLDRGKFWLRRLIRLTPPLVVMVVVVTVFRIVVLNDVSVALQEGFYALTYSTNLRTAFLGGYPDNPTLYLGHTWSLAVEEQFYLFWPIVLAWATTRIRQDRLVALGLAYPLLAVAGRWAVVELGWPDLMQFPLFRLEGFGVGLAIAFLLRSRTFARSVVGLTIAGVVAALFLVIEVTMGEPWRQHWEFVPFAALDVFASGVLIVAILRGSRVLQALLSGKILTALGRMSYSVYLWHLPVFVYVNDRRFPSTPKLVLAMIEGGITFALAAVSYYGIEARLKPTLDRFRPAPSPTTAMHSESRT